MTDITLDIGDTYSVTLQNGAKLYLAEHELGGLLVVGDREFLIQPRADNSIRIVIADRAAKGRGNHK